MLIGIFKITHIFFWLWLIHRNLGHTEKRAFNSLTHSSWHVCVDVASRTIRLNTSLFWASLPPSVELIGSHFFMSSVHLLVGRPFLLLPSSLASNMCLSRESCLFRWPKYDSFLALMLSNNQSWPTFSSFRISVFFLFAIHGFQFLFLKG